VEEYEDEGKEQEFFDHNSNISADRGGFFRMD
jgi:hypothetical protein